MLVRDATRQIRGYKNGVLALSSSYVIAPRTNAQPQHRPQPGPAPPVSGLMDEVRIYDRVLSEREIQALFAG